MSRFRFSPEERRRRGREAASGWGSTRGMTSAEFVALRERKALDKKRREEEMRKRRMAGAKGQPAAMPRRRGGFGKILIFLLIIAAIVYYYLKYVKK